MTIEFEGKSPNKIWYAWQHVKSYTKIFTDKNTKPKVKSAGVSAALTAGIPAAGWFSSMPLGLLLLPFVGPFGPAAVIAAGAGAGAFFGWRTYGKIKEIKNSPVLSDYIRDQERKWLKKKQEPKSNWGFAWRIFAISSKFAAASFASTAVMGGLQYAGVITSIPVAAASLPVAIAALSSFAVISAAAGYGFSKLADRSGSKPERKISAKAAPAANNNQLASVKPASPDFTASAAPKPEMTQREKAAAAAREAARKSKKSAPKF